MKGYKMPEKEEEAVLTSGKLITGKQDVFAKK
jgi:hypothetical protein